MSTLRTLSGGRAKSLAASATGAPLAIHIIALPENAPPFPHASRARARLDNLSGVAGSSPVRSAIAHGENPTVAKRTIGGCYG